MHIAKFRTQLAHKLDLFQNAQNCMPGGPIKSCHFRPQNSTPVYCLKPIVISPVDT